VHKLEINAYNHHFNQVIIQMLVTLDQIKDKVSQTAFIIKITYTLTVTFKLYFPKINDE